MNRDDFVVQLARAAGLDCKKPALLDAYQHFARLIAAAEREKCAELAECYQPDVSCNACPRGLADAIRNRQQSTVASA